MYKLTTWFLVTAILCAVAGGVGYAYGTKHVEKGFVYIEGFKKGTSFGMECICKYRNK